MKILFFVATFLLCVPLSGQNYFNKLYDEDTISILSVAGKLANNGYVVVGGFNGSNGYSATYARKIDLLGNTVWAKVLDGGVQYSSIVQGNALVATADSNFLVADWHGTDVNNADWRLIKFNGQGDTLWKHSYYSPNYTDVNLQVLNTPDHGFLLSGGRYYYILNDSISPMEYYVMKVDSNGIKQWEATYGLNAVLLYTEPTSDGGYILSGYRDYPPQNYDMYVVKIDSIGTMEWERNYGTPEDDGGCQVIEYAPKQYALFGLWNSELPTGKKYLYYTRLDSIGNPIGEAVTYEKNGIYSPEALYMTSEQEFIVGLVSCCPSAPETCTLAKFNLLGERLWEVPIESGVYDNDYLRDIEPTPDGGYLLVGFNYTPTADSWVIKVDSLGQTCGIANCDSTITVIDVIDPIPQRHSEFTISPNPAKNSVVLNFTQPTAHNGYVQLLDINGRLQQQVNIAANSTACTVDITTLQTGIYYCRLNNGQTTAKLVIIK